MTIKKDDKPIVELTGEQEEDVDRALSSIRVNAPRAKPQDAGDELDLFQQAHDMLEEVDDYRTIIRLLRWIVDRRDVPVEILDATPPRTAFGFHTMPAEERARRRTAHPAPSPDPFFYVDRR